MGAIRGPILRPSCLNGGSKVLEYTNGGVPVYAGIGDGDALFQPAGALRWDLLVAFVDVGLNHDANDARLAFAELVRDSLRYLGLVAVVFVRVSYLLSVRVEVAVREKTNRASSPP